VKIAIGSLCGATVAAIVAPLMKPWFHVPGGGVGYVTITAYPKGWDYAVVALLAIGAFAGGAFFVAPASQPAVPPASSRRAVTITALLVFLVMFFIHDHPFVPMDMFHEGEHLTPASLMRDGARPYGDVFLLHGLAIDGGLDSLILGDPPSPLRMRRAQTLLDAATLALLVPIAAEVTASGIGMAIAAIASICAIGAGQVPVFPYHRLLPIVLATLGLLRYARTGRARALMLAFLASTLGVLWGLDTGSYALAGTVAAFAVMRLFRLEARHPERREGSQTATIEILRSAQDDGKPLPLARVLTLAAIALAAPLVVLLAVRADIRQFFVDSFVTIPSAIDAVWALPAPADWKTAVGLRYYLPPAFYGFLVAFALGTWRRGDRGRAAQIAIVAILSLVAFRTAAGRVSWSHTRFATPLLGIALVAFVVEPLVLARRRVIAVLLAIPLSLFLELAPNFTAGAKLIANWRGRQRHEGMVRYPFAAGRGIYTSPENAETLATLRTFIDSLGPRDAPIFDFSNERALYYFLRRRPPSRCFDVPMLSSPRLLAEAMRELNARPPVCVIAEGDPALFGFDGITNRDRVPELAAWIDANYPKRTRIGRFVVASR
jgi:hypothetical protein